MTITLVNVSTLNGKITRGNDPHVPNWSSVEDQKHFASIVKEFEVIILGRRTYEASLKESKTKLDSLKVVMTRYPAKYKDKVVTGRLEFTDESPTKLAKRLKDMGIRRVMLASGGNINSQFFKKGLVNNIVLTVEPLIFGKGTPLIAELGFEVKMHLEEFKRLNEKGTIILRYSVIS